METTMATKAYPSPRSREPLILIVPESAETSPDHWQTRWERHRDNCQRLDLGMWDDPHRNTWINKLNLAIYRATEGSGDSSGRPVLLVGHGLGCLTIAWWAEYERPSPNGPVIGALLIAPPDPDRPGADPSCGDPRLAKFAACPRQPLPFPAFVVASASDPGCSLRSAIQLARDWDCRFADAGATGHIDAASGLGDWALGQRLLGRLLNEYRPGSYDGPMLFAPARKPAPQAARGLDS
jgi:predicted alpha/beta hydrolase family esterase